MSGNGMRYLKPVSRVFLRPDVLVPMILLALLGWVYIAYFGFKLVEILLIQAMMFLAAYVVVNARTFLREMEESRLYDREELVEYYEQAANSGRSGCDVDVAPPPVYVDSSTVQKRYEALYEYLRKNMWIVPSRKQENGMKKIMIPGLVEILFPPGARVYVETAPPSNGWRVQMDEILEPHRSQLVEFYRRSYGWNDLKSRLVRVEERDGAWVLVVEPVAFHRVVLGSYAVDTDLGGRTYRMLVEPLLLSGDDEYPLLPVGEASRHPTPNQVGFNTLTVSRDGILLQIREPSTIAAREKAIHSISAVLEWRRITFHQGSEGLVDAADLAVSEAFEPGEIGPKPKAVYPVALTRNLRFLAQPELNLAAYTNASLEEIAGCTKLGRGSETYMIGIVPLREPLDAGTPGFCDLLRVIVESLVEPLRRGGVVDVFILDEDAKKRGAASLAGLERRRLDVDDFSSSLLVGLQAMGESYERLCVQR